MDGMYSLDGRKWADANPITPEDKKIKLQVKIISHHERSELEDRINEWLYYQLEDVKVKDIKFSASEHTAFIIYEERI